MTTRDKELAERVTGGGRESVWFVEHGGELYPLDKDARKVLPDDVLDGDREPDEAETLRALQAQGYTL